MCCRRFGILPRLFGINLGLLGVGKFLGGCRLSRFLTFDLRGLNLRGCLLAGFLDGRRFLTFGLLDAGLGGGLDCSLVGGKLLGGSGLSLGGESSLQRVGSRSDLFRLLVRDRLLACGARLAERMNLIVETECRLRRCHWRPPS
ncbi:MAG: hypothetical protein JO267_11650 [Alphaproteobacteria bacterium]|nr:hypothetical protein [Alphaproteobacteria bacterium]